MSTSSKALTIETFEQNTSVNTTSVLVAAQQAVTGFKELPKTAARTFIFTGNILNVVPVAPALLEMGMGKAATAQLMMTAVAAYHKSHGFK